MQLMQMALFYVKVPVLYSFRSRMEGWNIICSAELCTGPLDGSQQHMHNGVHIWVGGHMDVAASVVNDPIFNLVHCNVDRILESWMRRFATESSNSEYSQRMLLLKEVTLDTIVTALSVNFQPPATLQLTCKRKHATQTIVQE